MGLQCPDCKLAMNNYTGCAALICGMTERGQEGGCGTAYCALCFQSCRNEGNDAHNHCKRVHGTWAVSTPQWHEAMRELKQKRLEEYWPTISEDIRGELIKDASVRTHFTDLRMPVPGEGQFAAQLVQLHGMGF